MSSTYIPAELRRLVIDRANGLCEYCLTAQEDAFYGCAVDHIISEKHGGPTVESNLAFACVFCNQAKGSDIGSILWPSREFVRLFDPRIDEWGEHFVLVGNRIEGLTPIGSVTERLLGFNSPERLLERETLQGAQRFPSRDAQQRMKPPSP